MKDTKHLKAMIEQYQRIIEAIEANEPLLEDEVFETEFLPISESLIDYGDNYDAIPY